MMLIVATFLMFSVAHLSLVVILSACILLLLLLIFVSHIQSLLCVYFDERIV